MYPSVTCCPSNINFNCVTDCTETKILIVQNDSSIPVYFKLRWLEESIAIKKNFLKLPVSKQVVKEILQFAYLTKYNVCFRTTTPSFMKKMINWSAVVAAVVTMSI